MISDAKRITNVIVILSNGEGQVVITDWDRPINLLYKKNVLIFWNKIVWLLYFVVSLKKEKKISIMTKSYSITRS